MSKDEYLSQKMFDKRVISFDAYIRAGACLDKTPGNFGFILLKAGILLVAKLKHIVDVLLNYRLVYEAY